MTPLTRLVVARECPYCAAGPGAWCWSPKSGLKARYLHADRGREVYEAWRIGYREAMDDQDREAADHLDRVADQLERDGHRHDNLPRYGVVRWLHKVAEVRRSRS